MEFKSGNPTFKENIFKGEEGYFGEIMTMQGTVNKTYMLLTITFLSALGFWYYLGVDYLGLSLIAGGIISLVLVFLISFFPKTSPYVAPFYAIFEGLFLGAISLKYELQIPGIVIQSMCLTFAIFLSMLLAYQSGLVKATEKFKMGIIAATFGIAIFYIINLILSLTGLYSMLFIHQTGIIGIGFSLFVVVIASLNLVLDFDFIETSIKNNLPKHLEWYASVSLIVTLAWLYIEILRLLSKLRSSD